MTKEDIELVRLALSVYHTRTVYPGCVEAFERIIQEQEMPKKLGCAADHGDTCFPCQAKGVWCEKREQLTKTPENVTCENLSNADERQAALDALNDICYKLLSEDDAVKRIETIRAALQSPRAPDYMFKKLGSLIKAVDRGTFENDPHDAVIDAAIHTLSSPNIPVIEGLDEAINPGRPWAVVNNDTGVIAVPMKDFQSLQKAARAYAELQKGV